MVDSKLFFRTLLPSGQNSLPSPARIFGDAVNLLGQTFSVSRAAIFTIQKGRIGAKVTYEYRDVQTDSIMGKQFPSIPILDSELLGDLNSVICTDIRKDERFKMVDLETDWGMRSFMAAPLVFNDTIVAIVCLQHGQPRDWTIREIEQFKATIDKISHVLEIIRPFAEMKKQFERYLIVNDLVRHLTLVTNISDLFHTLVIELRKIVAFDFVFLHLIDEMTGRLQSFEQAHYVSGRFAFGQFLPSSFFISGWCIANRRSMLIRDLNAEKEIQVRRDWLDAGLNSCAAFPLLFADQVSGAISFFSQSKANLDEAELLIMQQGIEQGAAAIHRIRTISQLVKNVGVDIQAARREELIKRISKAIGSHLEPTLVLQHAVNELGRHLIVSRCYIALVDIYEEETSKIFEYNAPKITPLVGLPLPIRANRGLAETAYRDEPITFSEVQSEPDLKAIDDFLRKNGVRSALYHHIATNGDQRAYIFLEQCDRTRTWTEDEVELVRTVSQELAIALEQAELVAKLQAQAEREALLNRITAAIRASLEPREILHTTVEELGKTLNVAHCFIGLANLTSEKIIIESEYCAPGIEPIAGRVIDQRFLQELCEIEKSGSYFSTSNVLKDEKGRQLQEVMNLPSAVSSVICMPIFTNKRLIAVIGVSQINSYRRWKEEELSFIRGVADQVAVAIEQAQLLEQTRNQAEREAFLNQIFITLSDSLEQSEILNKVVDQVGQKLSTDRCIISLYEQETGRWLGIQSEYIAKESRHLIGNNRKNLDSNQLLHWLNNNLRPFVLNDIADYPFSEGKDVLTSMGVRSLLIVPIVFFGKLFGSIGLYQYQDLRKWLEAEIDLMRTIATQAAVAINNSYLFQCVANGQRHWQRTFDSMTDGVALLAPDGKIICANHAMFRLCGVQHWNELIGTVGQELFPALDQHKIEPNPFEESLKGISMQFEIQDKQNRILRENLDPIIDDNREVTELVLVVRDVTRERRAELEMAQRNRELSTLNAISEEITKSLEIDKIIISAFGKAVEVMGADTGLVMLLDETQELLRPVAYHGQLPEIVVGMLTHIRYRKGFLDIDGESKETFVIDDLAKNNDAPDQSFVKIAQRLGLRSAIITNLQSKNRTLGLLTIAYRQRHKFQEQEIQLITAIGRQVGVAIENARLIANLQDALQELREANRLKDEFLATLSHELRTPLTSIRGWAEILSERPDNDEEMDMGLKAILNNSESLQQLINDLLELSRIENRVLKLELEATDINMVISAAVQTVKQMADNREIVIGETLSNELPLINADSNRLQQVFWNLLSNSIKFSSHGGRVDIATSLNDNMIEVKVIDNGIGIEPEFLPLVFERFRQADSSSTRRYGGLGIGLSLVKSLVEVHGGDVKAESDGKGQGSTFTVRFPVPQKNSFSSLPIQGPQPLTLKEPVPDITEGHKLALFNKSNELRALLIEDLEDNMRLLTSILQKLGFEILTARTSEAGLLMAERHLPAVIFLDINMPGRNPAEVIKSFHNCKKLLDIPIIAVSAFSLEDERQIVLTSGFSGLITKPFRRGEIAAMVRKLVKISVVE